MHEGTLSQHAQAALATLSASSVVSRWYLAGGTALALQLGHRLSYDLDFYVQDAVLASDVAAEISKLGRFKTTLLEPPHTLIGEFNEVKFSLFRYTYPLLRPFAFFSGIAIASPEDIMTMKLTAICSRATKRDYVDLYVLVQKGYSFDQALTWYTQKFGQLGNNLYVIITALKYFEDAEADDMPKMLVSLSWEEVKKFLASESLRLGKKYLGDIKT